MDINGNRHLKAEASNALFSLVQGGRDTRNLLVIYVLVYVSGNARHNCIFYLDCVISHFLFSFIVILSPLLVRFFNNNSV